MNEIQIVTVPFIMDGTPFVKVFVGIPVYDLRDKKSILLQFRSKKSFLGQTLEWDWGYLHSHEPLDLPPGTVAPENFRWQKVSIPLDSWDEIPNRVDEVIKPLKEIKSSYDTLMAAMPSPEYKFVSL